jgi:xylose isomerase
MNVGSCSDRYCPAYGRPFSTEELFERCASIPQLSGVDLVATPDLMEEKELVAECVEETGLEIVSIAADTFTEPKWRQGSFSSPDPDVRAQAVEHGKAVMDWCAELGTDLRTTSRCANGSSRAFANSATTVPACAWGWNTS